MALTRSVVLQEARRQAEKEDDLDRYPDASLALLFGVVFRSEWRRLLDWAPRYRVRQTVHLLPSGGAVISSADLCGGLVGAEVHRLQQVAVNDQLLPENRGTGPTLVEVPTTTPVPAWRWENEALVVEGCPAGSSVRVTASILPPLPQSDDEALDWPDEFAFVLIYELAGRMLTKGSVESGEAADQFRMADAERQRLQRALWRKGMTPDRLRPDDDARDWGLG